MLRTSLGKHPSAKTRRSIRCLSLAFSSCLHSGNMRFILCLVLVILCPSWTHGEQLLSYTDIISKHCSPPFYYYKSWCYYVFPNITLDWTSAYRLCRSIDRHTYLVYISGDDDMVDPLRDILIHREKSLHIKSLWTNTTWGHQRRTILTRQGKRSCRKIELKSTLKSGQIDMLRMPFTNCREKHSVMCRKELPANVVCRRPWALAYGFCYYLDEQSRVTETEEEDRDIAQCEAWDGQLFTSSKQEKTMLSPFLSYSLSGLRSSRILTENFGGIAYQFRNLLQENCTLISGDVYSSTAITDLKSTNQTQLCSSFSSYTLCRQQVNTTCEPPWFYDDGFCLYHATRSLMDMAAGSIECTQHGGHLLYISNEEELFRLTRNLLFLAPFFKSRALAGVWLPLSYKAISSADEDSKVENDFHWQWDLSVDDYLDASWKSLGWRKFFQHRLSPSIVSAGDCGALILDSQIREPIERTSCFHQRTVICRKPLEYETRSFHKKSLYEKFARVQNLSEPFETVRKANNQTSTFAIHRTVFEPLNATTDRLIIFLNGSSSSSLSTQLIFTCKSKGILWEKTIAPNDSSPMIIADMSNRAASSDYQVLFTYLRSSNCTNTSTHQCIYLSCTSNDPWSYSLPEMFTRLNLVRQQASNNQRCIARYRTSAVDAQICSLLIDQFRVSEEVSIEPSSKTNECQHFGGQCVPETLVTTAASMAFASKDLTCSEGSICWFQGERCHPNAYCIDRVRFPCPPSSRRTDITCSNARYECCSSLEPSIDTSLYIADPSATSTWNIFLPIYYFSFHGASKWDRFFFDAWLRMGSDISQDFINDEFLFSCKAIFIDPTLLLTHQSCLPTRLTTFDKRSILFSLVPKPTSNPEEIEYDKVALHIDTYQISAPFQLVRLSYRHDFLANKTFKLLSNEKTPVENRTHSHCVLAVDDNDVRSIRLIDNFERQFVFDDRLGAFAFIDGNEQDDDDDPDEPWSFAPVVCISQDRQQEWTIVGISGQQLNHKCQRFNRQKYCQMNFVYSSASIL